MNHSLGFKKHLVQLSNIFSEATEVVIGHLLLNQFKANLEFMKSGNPVDSNNFEDFEWPLDLIWEKIHAVKYSDVHIAWRIGYAAFSLLNALYQYKCGHLQNALEACDKAFLFGDCSSLSIIEFGSEINKLMPPKSLTAKQNETMEPSAKQMKLSPKNEVVPVISNPSCQEVIRLMNIGQPFIIEGALADWPALNKWSIAYIQKIAGYHTVPIEIGAKYSDEEWTQALMTINEFVDIYMCEESENIGYLAQHTLFDQIPELAEDWFIPDYCYLGDSSAKPNVNAWFGPKGTVSPLHQDPKKNFFAQVFGSKSFVMIDDVYRDKLYLHDDKMLFNTSAVNIESPDFELHPNFRKVQQKHCFVESGQLLYIPPKYWHFVKSLSPSFSISFWFE